MFHTYFSPILFLLVLSFDVDDYLGSCGIVGYHQDAHVLRTLGGTAAMHGDMELGGFAGRQGG
jgi:hypothetical protein